MVKEKENKLDKLNDACMSVGSQKFTDAISKEKVFLWSHVLECSKVVIR